MSTREQYLCDTIKATSLLSKPHLCVFENLIASLISLALTGYSTYGVCSDGIRWKCGCSARAR